MNFKNINKKKVITGIVIIIIIGILIADKITSSTPSIAPSPTPGVSISNTDQPDKLNVSGVGINNFYKNSADSPDNLHTTFESKDHYQFIYFPQNKQFLVSILGQPFDKTREAAEQDFLIRLGITKEDACKLNVGITTPRSINPQESGKVYNLSFCKSK